eukprot:scaffold105366_cov31-Tisochrysis_lutea.AAC.1
MTWSSKLFRWRVPVATADATTSAEARLGARRGRGCHPRVLGSARQGRQPSHGFASGSQPWRAQLLKNAGPPMSLWSW